MRKVPPIIKKILKIILWFVGCIVLIFLIVAALIQFPFIQNKLIHYATSYVSNKTHTRVEIKNISVGFPKSVVIKGLFLDDLQKDTLIYAGEVKIDIALKDLLHSKITVNSVDLKNAKLNVIRKPNDSLFNYNFLLTAFSSGTPAVKNLKETPSKWTFSLKNVTLNQVRLLYDDKYGGTNILGTLGNVALNVESMDFDKSVYTIDKMLAEGVSVNLRMDKPANTLQQNNSSTSGLPKIVANKIEITNSLASYMDTESKFIVNSVIKDLVIKKGSLDLQKEIVLLDQLNLSKSEFNYKSEDLAIAPDPKAKVVISPESNWNVTVNNIALDDNTIAYRSGNKKVLKGVFDANALNYSHLTLNADDLFYSPEKTAVSVKSFSAKDQNMFAITRFETEFSMDPHSIIAKNLKAKTTNSSVDADLQIKYASLKSLIENWPYTIMNLNMRKVSIKNSDILYFNPLLFKQPFFKNLGTVTTVSGIVNGPINSLKGKNIVLTTGAKTVLKTDFSIVGLPNVDMAFYDFPNLQLVSGKRDLNLMAGTYIPQSITLPDEIEMKVAFKGKIKSFETTVAMNSNFGNGVISASIDNDDNFKGNVKLNEFNLGRFLKDTAMYGPVTLTAETKGQGLDLKTIKATIKAEATKIYLKGYTYHNLKIDGNINGESFEGKVNLNDENAVLAFDGLVDLNPKQEHFKFTLNANAMELKKMNFTTDDVRIGLVAVVDLKGDPAKMSGRAEIANMNIEQGVKIYVLDSLLVASVNEPDRKPWKGSNAYIGLKYSGSTSPTDLQAALAVFMNNYFPFTAENTVKPQNTNADFSFEIQLHNNYRFTQMILPQLFEFEPGLIKGSFDSQKKLLKLNVAIKKVVYGTTEMDDFVASVNSNTTTLNYKLAGSSISNAQAKLDNFMLDGKIENKTVFARISSLAENQNKKFLINAQIKKDKDNYKLSFDPKEFYLMNNRWDIEPDNYIEFGNEGFLIHHFTISNSGREIKVASVHDKFNDDLNIGIRNFRLDDLSRIIEKDTSLVKGTVDGNVLLKRVNGAYGIIADAKISNLKVSDVAVGDLTLKADNPTSEKFDIDMRLEGSGNELTAKGFYIPNSVANDIKIQTDIQSLSMKTVQAFSMGEIIEASGSLKGNVLVQGMSNAPDITGEILFSNVFIKPAVLNNRLELKNETIRLKNDGIYFNAFTLLDVGQHTAIIDGTVKMKQFKDFVYALHVNTQDFLLFNSTVKNNKVFFGKMVIDSKIDINGPMLLPVVNGNIKMKKGSNFTFAVPADEINADKGEGVVEFEKFSIPKSTQYGKVKIPEQKSGFSGFDLSSVIEIDKQATLRLLMDPSSTDSLVVKGEAALSLTIDRSGKMSLAGTYNLNEGSYLVSLESVIKKKFDISSGSTITWNGDPMVADISINATYSVQAAPYDLVAVQMSGLSDAEKGGYKQRYPFLVMLKLRGALLHPVISFEIQLKPEDKGILGGAVNQKLNMLNDDESELNKQVFALLVLGRFVQDNPFQTESGGTSTMVRSTVGNFLSAQLNKLSSKYIPGVELNFDVQSYDDYQTGQAQGRTQVAIGIKKQLFNERLSVQLGGTVGVEGAKSQQNSTSDITSDVTIEYKLTDDGSFLVCGFRHNLYEGAIEGQLVETGAGVVYVKDFTLWKEFFKPPMKKSKVLKKTKADEKNVTK